MTIQVLSKEMNSIAQTSNTGESDPLQQLKSKQIGQYSELGCHLRVDRRVRYSRNRRFSRLSGEHGSDRLCDCDSKVSAYRGVGQNAGVYTQSCADERRIAIAEDAPIDAIQKIGDRWLRLADIQNDSNRRSVDELARKSEVLRPADS